MEAFIYYGHFYRLMIAGVEYCCRSTLEIIRSCDHELRDRAECDPSTLLVHPPDAVFIMLNPGGSAPCDAQAVSNCVGPQQICSDAYNLVRTRRDDTQRAIERVMICKRFTHVRILNLFDIRQVDSSRLVTCVRASLRLQRLPQSPEIMPYSIFSPERRCELMRRLDIANRRVVVAAWGTLKARPFFAPCCRTLSCLNLRIHGWRPQAQPPVKRMFYHPSRRLRKWPKYIVEHWPNDPDD